MSKVNSLWLTLSLGLLTGLAYADQGEGNLPGYVFSPASGSSLVKSAYGKCLHTAYYNADDGLGTCGEAPERPKGKVIEKVEFSESGIDLFQFGSAKLSDGGKAQLTKLINHAKDNGSIAGVSKVLIEGYTDTLGGYSYNVRLSADRATAVKDFLISLRVDSGTITAVGKGPQDAKVSAACIKNYNEADKKLLQHLAEEQENAETDEEINQINHEMVKFADKHPGLEKCTAPDRRVEITVEHVKNKTVEE